MKIIKKFIFTKEGYNEQKSKRDKLYEERKEAVKTLKAARELGDLSENGLYKAARARLSSIDNRLNRIEGLLKFGVIAEKPKQGTAGIGSCVHLDKNHNLYKYYLVGDYEADPINGKISHISPLGKQIIGKKEGDIINIKAPIGTITYKIKKII